MIIKHNIENNKDKIKREMWIIIPIIQNQHFAAHFQERRLGYCNPERRKEGGGKGQATKLERQDGFHQTT